MLGGFRDESAIVVDHPEEALELLDGRGRGNGANRFDAFGHRRNTGFVDRVS